MLMKIGIEGPKLQLDKIIDLWKKKILKTTIIVMGIEAWGPPPPLDETLTFNGIAREYVLL